MSIISFEGEIGSEKKSFDLKGKTNILRIENSGPDDMHFNRGDDVDIHKWTIPGRPGAGMVVMHNFGGEKLNVWSSGSSKIAINFTGMD